jgi:hypothetical protein
MKQVEVGVPLFFNWVPSGDRILLHVGDRGERTARLVLRDPFGPTEDVPYPRQPGSFCAPVFAAGRAAYAVAGEGHSRVVASGLDGGEPCDLLTANGLAAVVGAPGGRPWVAVSVADKGEGSPYRGIHLVNVHDGTRRRITDIDCMAFFWSPTGDWLLAAQVVADENCLRWWRVGVDGGQPLDLGTFWPTRDVLFYLHFFDQYTMSHPLVSPCGRWVSWAGYPAGGGHADLSNPPRIFVKRADGGGEAEDIAGGVFSVWSSG